MSDEEVLPTNVVVADGPSDAEENDEDDEDQRLDFTQTEYAVQMSQAEPLVENDEDEEGGGRKANKASSKPKAVQQLSEKVRK
ncbi:unnamed protein product [Phytophthora lilii]|uniref:Unnamed protein product n=1 Tax=Phytophthora lilii TaxID=2077276 RepID=A0A9W6TNF0_9STRA|nr:unnamed protein product [Phytophthora lilii]